MDRRVPSNPKYQGVQSKINSGTTVHKIQQISAKEYLKRRDEQYNRVGPISLYELFEEYEPKAETGFMGDEVNYSDRGGPRIVSYDTADVPQYTQPYLILDIRSPQEFDIGHIHQSRSFPAIMINQDRISPELYSFKNRAETLVIVYCDDEQKSRQTAQQLTEKGYENTFLLSGGFVEFADRFPKWVVGQPPQPPMARNIHTGRSTKSSRSNFGAPQRVSTGRSSGSTALSTRGPRNIPGTGRSAASGSGMGGYRQPLTQNNMRMMGGPSMGRGQDPDAVSEAGSCVSVAQSVISKASQKKGVFLNRRY